MTLPAALLAAAIALPAERTLECDLPALAARVTAFHGFGECRVVVAAAPEGPRARLVLVASGAAEPALRRFLELVQLDATVDPGSGGAAITVRSTFPAKEQQPEQISFAAELTLWLPERTALELHTSFGLARVEGRGADVKVVNRLAPIEVRDVKGSVDVENQFDRILVADVTGAVLARNKSGAITIERAGGRVEARTNGAEVRVVGAGSAEVHNHLKSVDLRNVAGDVRIVAPFCAVTAREVGGPLEIESNNAAVVVDGVDRDLTIRHRTGRIDARNVRGDATILGSVSDVTLIDVRGAAEVRSPAAPVRVNGVGGRLVAENSARTLDITDARGDVEASARGGLLKLRWSRLPADGAAHLVALESETGGIEIALPDGASVALDLTSMSGRIDCELPGMRFAQNGPARTGTLTLGDGKVKLHATCLGGAIRVGRAGAH